MQSTDLALSMEAAGDGARYDSASKKLMSYKSVMAWMLKLLTREFRGYDVDFIASNCLGEVSVSEKAVHQDQRDRTLDGNERVTMINSESSSMNEGRIYYDLRLRARVPGSDGDVCLFVNIEIQNDDRQKYALVTRGIYYCARMISEQYGTVFTSMDYQKIEKAYSIWISPDPYGKRRMSSITRYSVRKDDVLGKSFINRKDYDKIEVVVIKLGSDYECSRDSITGLLTALLSTSIPLERREEILSNVYGIAMTKEFEREVTEMCNLSSAVMEAGREKGLKEGRKEGSLIILFQLVDDGDLPIEKAASKANMTVEEFLETKKEFDK